MHVSSLTKLGGWVRHGPGKITLDFRAIFL